MPPPKVRCPQCATLVEYRTDNPFRPFCSERCKLIDLGAWAEGRYAIPSENPPAGDGEDEAGEGRGGRDTRLDS